MYKDIIQWLVLKLYFNANFSTSKTNIILIKVLYVIYWLRYGLKSLGDSHLIRVWWNVVEFSVNNDKCLVIKIQEKRETLSEKWPSFATNALVFRKRRRQRACMLAGAPSPHIFQASDTCANYELSRFPVFPARFHEYAFLFPYTHAEKRRRGRA